jgi:hypothetical protein
MTLEDLKTLKTNESDEQTLYEQMLAVLLEIKEIKDRFGASTDLDKDPESKVQRWFSGLNEEEKSNLIHAAGHQLSILNNYKLQLLQENVPILESIGTKLAKFDVNGETRKLNPEVLKPTMGALLYSNNLTEINTALEDGVAEATLKTYMGRYVQIAGVIASGSDERDDTYNELMQNLMESLSTFDGQGSIQDKFNAAFDALCDEYKEGRQESRGFGGLLQRFFRRPYVEAIDPKVLTNPFVESAVSASATPEAEAPAEVEVEAEAPAAPTPTPAAPTASTRSRPRNIPLRIASTAILGTMGLFGLAGLVSLIKQGFRPTAPAAPTTPPTGGSEAADAVLKHLDGAIAARIKTDNFGNVPATNDPVPLNELLRFQGQGGLRSKVGDISTGTREELMKLAEAAGITDTNKQNEMIAAYTNAYDAHINANVTGSIRDLNDVALRDRLNAEAMTESLKAVGEYIKEEHARAASPVGWLQDRFGDATDNIASAFTKTAERVVGSIPINASVAAEGPPVMVPSAPSPIQSFLNHTRGTMSAAMQNVGEAAQHVSHAVGQVVKSEPVQAALHNSATYTAVSLAVTATSVRFQAVREARQAEKIDGPKPSFAANAGGLARDFFTKDVGGPTAYQAQLNKATTKVALGRAAFAAICPPVAIAATAMGVTAFGAGVVHHVTKDNPELARVAAASEYLAKMEYVNQATGGMARGFTAAKTFATQAASSPLVTQAMAVTQTTMQTASNAFESAKKRTETMFASLFNRQATATL